MTVERITVTLPADDVREIRGVSSNVSGFVAEAVSDRLRWQRIREDLVTYQVDHGGFTAAELQAAREALVPWEPALTDAA